jgi:hypothetical protein
MEKRDDQVVQANHDVFWRNQRGLDPYRPELEPPEPMAVRLRLAFENFRELVWTTFEKAFARDDTNQNPPDKPS